MTELKFFLMVAIMAAVSALLRFIPFLVFGSGKKTPVLITKLGEMLPYAVIAMLIVYCLKGVRLFAFPYGLPEFISIALVAVLHLWKGNTLLSMIAGTGCYMILIQTVFI